MDTSIKFASLEDECKHWKAEARKLHKEYADVKEELDEFQESSQQLEAELEASLEQKEKQCRDLGASVQQMQLETESLYKRLVSCQSDYAQLEQRCTAVTEERDQLKSYTRQLEQINDNLERELRVVTENVTGFEAMLNEAYEKNALLEMEVDDKEKLQVMLQRLKDESRDLKQELIVRTTMVTTGAAGELSGSRTSLNSAATHVPTTTTTTATATSDEAPKTSETDTQTTARLSIIGSNQSRLHNHADSNNHKQPPYIAVVETQTKTDPTAAPATSNAAAQNPIKHSEMNGNAMSASSRLSALNLVAELLRKVNLDKLLCAQCDKFRCVCGDTAALRRPDALLPPRRTSNASAASPTFFRRISQKIAAVAQSPLSPPLPTPITTLTSQQRLRDAATQTSYAPPITATATATTTTTAIQPPMPISAGVNCTLSAAAAAAADCANGNSCGGSNGRLDAAAIRS